MWCNLSVGLITILSYTIDMGGKCLVFFFVDTKKDNEQIELWVQLSSCVAAVGFFLAFILLITIFKGYADGVTEEKTRTASKSGKIIISNTP